MKSIDELIPTLLLGMSEICPLSILTRAKDFPYKFIQLESLPCKVVVEAQKHGAINGVRFQSFVKKVIEDESGRRRQSRGEDDQRTFRR